MRGPHSTRKLVLRLLAVGMPTHVVCAPPLVFTRIQSIRELSPQEAARNYPVHIRAVVTHYDRDFRNLFVQDATAGIYVDTDRPLSIERGQEIDVDGVTGPGDFAPVIRKPTLRVIGRGTVPRPLSISLQGANVGAYDCQWVEGDGVVNSAAVENGHLDLYVPTTMGRAAKVQVVRFPRVDVDQLVDAQIHFRGTLGPTFNSRRQLTGLVVHVQDFSDISVDRADHTGAWLLPVKHVSDLLQFTPAISDEKRVRVQGAVTFQQPGRAVFIRDGDRADGFDDPYTTTATGRSNRCGWPTEAGRLHTVVTGRHYSIPRTRPGTPAHSNNGRRPVEGRSR